MKNITEDWSQAYSGVFHLLPLGLRVQDKLVKLVDKHMQSIGANKVALATITSEALWRKSGRYTGNNPEMFHLSSPKPTGFLLSPTHEEEITSVVASSISSYKDLPLRLYQISRKYRNELRPRAGLLRTREFLMKDLYTFDTSPSTALSTYNAVKAAYINFFNDLRLPYLVADADSGDMGGDLSHEFHYATPLGEDTVISCTGCGWAVNEELAAARGVERSRGDGEDWGECPKCHSGELKGQRAVEVGHTFYLGTRYSVPLDCTVDLPSSSPSGSSATTTTTTATATTTAAGTTTKTPLSMGCHGIGLSRLLGTLPLLPSSNSPKSSTPATQTQTQTLTWPLAIAPYDCILIPAIRTPTTSSDTETLYDMLSGGGCVSGAQGGNGAVEKSSLDIILDDRPDLSPGWKLKDADLIGYPIVIVLGRGWTNGKVEVQCRALGVREEVEVSGLREFVVGVLGRL